MGPTIRLCETGKYAYADQETARTALQRLAARGVKRIYRCPRCQFWHLTSQPWRCPRR
jgi:rubrerythrin